MTIDNTAARKAVRLLKYIPLLLLAIVALASCSEEDDTVEEYANWEETNRTEWNRIYADAQQRIAAGDTSWKIIKNWSLQDTLHTENTAYIVVKVNEAGTGSGCPLYTDSVRVHYKGRLLPSTSYSSGYQFDSTWGTATSIENAVPQQYLVSGYSDGFATALQNMHIGDNWTVYIPWTLAYGASGYSNIPGYSVLIFDMQLVSYYRAGQQIPDVKAKVLNAKWIEQ